MKYVATLPLLLFALDIYAQGLVEKPAIEKVPLTEQDAGLPQKMLIRSFDMRMFEGRPSRKRLDSANEVVLLQDVLIEAAIAAGPKASGACQVRLLINDVPLRMSLRHVEGTRGQRRPVYPPEDGSPPAGLVTTLTVPSIYAVLLEPVTGPVKLDPKDRVEIELSSPQKMTDCSARANVSTMAAKPSRKGKKAP